MENPDRVRANSPEETNRRIDRKLEACVREYAYRSPAEITHRINELDREWDMERLLEANASALAFTGLMLGLKYSKKWMAVPCVVLPFLFQHALQGWCPPVPLFRWLGVRTREEIDREKYALKVLRGDFEKKGATSPAEEALEAVKA